jgi:hypothetical protein
MTIIMIHQSLPPPDVIQRLTAIAVDGIKAIEAIMVNNSNVIDGNLTSPLLR